MLKKQEEYELKYNINDNEELYDKMISLFEYNGFKVLFITNKENIDEYYDTKKFNLYKSGGSLRIRKFDQDKINATYKFPIGYDEVYSSRGEIEINLSDDKFETFKERMVDLGIDINFNKVLKYPILKVNTERVEVLLEKNNIQVYLSFDNSKYTNHILNNISSIDRMVEVEYIGEYDNIVILDNINSFITSSFQDFYITKQSKYEKGIDKTLELYNSINQQNCNNNIKNLIKKLK